MNVNQRITLMEKYKKAYVELDAIIDTFDEETRNMIPSTFRSFIKNKKDPTYQFKLEENKTLLEQNLMQETYNLVSLIYRNYFCSKEEKERLALQDREELKRKEQEEKEKYDTDRIFKERIAQNEAEKERLNSELEAQEKANSLIAYNELPWYKKIFKFIKNLFKKN